MVDRRNIPGLGIEPIKYVRVSRRRGRTHTICETRDGVVTTLCGYYFVVADRPMITEKIYSRTLLCKRCKKARS